MLAGLQEGTGMSSGEAESLPSEQLAEQHNELGEVHSLIALGDEEQSQSRAEEMGASPSRPRHS